MRADLSPIVLFVYNRPWHTRQTLEFLSKNILADKSKLFIYADGPKKNIAGEHRQKIKEVRAIIREKKWCAEVEIIERTENMGLANSIILGVTEVVNKYGKIIVLEDDLVTSVGFLQFMNDALTMYQHQDNVMHVSGYMFPVKTKTKSDTFFFNSTSCWGWGTWAGSWSCLNINATDLYHRLIASGRIKEYTLDNTNGLEDNIQQVINGKIDAWAVCWHTSVFLRNGFCLHPCESLVRNIGHDMTGINCKKSWWATIYTEQKIAQSVFVEPIKLVEDKDVREAVKVFYMSLSKPPLWVKAKEKMDVMLSRFIQ